MAGYDEGTEPGSHGFLDTLLGLGRAPASAANVAGTGSTSHNDPSFTDELRTKVSELWEKLKEHPATATAPAYPAAPTAPTAPTAQYTDRGGHLRGGTPGTAPLPQVAPTIAAPAAPGFTFPAKRPGATGQLEAENQPPRRGTQ